MKKFSTSMMCIDYFNLKDQIKVIEKHTDLYHIDMMDGHFVPNLALSFDFIKQLRAITDKPIDVHLMMDNPSDFVDLLIELDVDYICFHPNTIERDVFRLIKKIKQANIKFGIVLSPSMGLDSIRYYKEHVDKITVMTVEPGFAGQKVIPEAISKIKDVYNYRKDNHLDFLIEVDGSNNYETFGRYFENGTDIFILGSTLFKEDDLEQSFLNIKDFVGKLNV